jgi:protein-tyrosine phosphatase
MNRRRIELEGAVNFRDLGGYPAEGGRTMRWRTNYRSDSLSDLTDSDVCDFRQLGINTLCDLRSSLESERKPNHLPNGHGINVVLLPFIPEGTLDMLSAINRGQYGPADVEREVLIHYKKFVNDHASEYRRVFEVILSKDSLPLLMHCTSGKDRTGFAAAAVLLAVGVPREMIVRDYAMTNDFRRDIRHLFSNDVSKPTIDALTSANPRYIEAALDEIDARFGTTEAWLESLGVSPSRRARLRDLLTE